MLLCIFCISLRDLLVSPRPRGRNPRPRGRSAAGARPSLEQGRSQVWGTPGVDWMGRKRMDMIYPSPYGRGSLASHLIEWWVGYDMMTAT